MSRVRLLGPSARLDAVLAFAQNEGVLHVVEPELAAQAPGSLPQPRAVRHCRRVLDDVEVALAALEATAVPPAPGAGGPVPLEVRFARRTRREAGRLTRELAAIEDERVVLLRYRDFFAAFAPLWGRELTWPDGHPFYVVMRPGALAQIDQLQRELVKLVGDEVELVSRPLPSREHAVLIIVPSASAQRVARLLSDSRVQELPAPPSLGEKNLLRSMGTLQERLAELPLRTSRLKAEQRRLRAASAPRLQRLRSWVHDQLRVLDAREKVHAGAHLFVVEGFLPREHVASFTEHAVAALGPEVVVETVSSERWHGTGAPVVLRNPPLLRPFELLTRRLPLPRYGSIDPTPFVAVFFPAFFGLMLGDVGYGALLGAVAIALRVGSKPKTTRRQVSAVAGACAISSVLFGVLFGELFGTLGKPLGMHPLWFDREHAVVPFLGLSIAIGVVHISLGLMLAAVTAWRRGHRREAAGRSVATLMVALTVAALLAAFELLPRGLLTPTVIALLVAFPLLIVLEGALALIELMSTFGHILSYARIMALGTASLMLAVVANQMVGALGSVVVGAVFALLFHLVNFAIGIFSPTLHALRLHYVEFFGKFFSPGGTEYRPLSHWKPQQGT